MPPRKPKDHNQPVTPRPQTRHQTAPRKPQNRKDELTQERVSRPTALPAVHPSSSLTHPSAFAQRLKQLRKARGLTQIELAQRIGVTPGYIGHLEVARRVAPSPELLNRLAMALDCSLDELAPALGMTVERLPLAESGPGRHADLLMSSPRTPEVLHIQAKRMERQRVSQTQAVLKYVSRARLQWAVSTIAGDPDYPFAGNVRSDSLAPLEQLLWVNLYERTTGRNLLTPEEAHAYQVMHLPENVSNLTILSSDGHTLFSFTADAPSAQNPSEGDSEEDSEEDSE